MLKLKSVDLKKVKISTLAVPVCEDKDIHGGVLSKLTQQAINIEEFHGKKDEELTLYNPSGTLTERVQFIGLGECANLDPEKLRAFTGKAVKAAIKKGLKDIVIGTPSSDRLSMTEADLVSALMEGACLGNHVFDKYKKDKKLKPLKQITLMVSPDAVKKFAKLPKRVEAICKGTLLARDWVSTPSNDKTPSQLSKIFINMAKKENLKTTLLNPKQLQQGKFGALMAVAAGSSNTPRLVVLEYAPKGAKQTVALIGKGVTFDAGGINLKPTGGIEDMKIDMSGAATVAATLITAAKLKPKVRIVGVMPLVENMISGSATRPGDIIKSHAGKTIEIGNTDAEGRLILADAMSYAKKKYKPDVMVDVATLTGACVVALGEKIAGLFTQDDALAEAILASGQKTHERTWRLPLPEDYKELLKSDFADTNNMSSTRWGGAITAALFLSGFAGDTRWAHIDIAGPAYQKKGSAYCDAGGTGFGVRLFCDLMDRLG
ncbi:MAG: leucyl aminopeptidase [Desulfobacterales bacterium]|nr:leucyl aminopeptidase [Desulfobacterales bacterium]MDX2512244.1 leucyl aminopeptidase [Desulfobacterales bacterium]